jgi:hypothetical protein
VELVYTWWQALELWILPFELYTLDSFHIFWKTSHFSSFHPVIQLYRVWFDYCYYFGWFSNNSSHKFHNCQIFQLVLPT